MEDRTAELECNECLSQYHQQGFSGVAYGYAVSAREKIVGTHFEYALMSESASFSRKVNENGTRAHREMRRSEGRKVPIIKDGALRDEILVLPGAAMSAADVVSALKRLAETIEKNGIRIGTYKGKSVTETLDGALTLREA